MKKSKYKYLILFVIAVCICIVCTILFQNYNNRFRSLVDAYTNGTLNDQLLFAMDNEMFSDIGFEKIEYKWNNCGYRNNDEDFPIVYYYSKNQKFIFAELSKKYVDYDLKVSIEENIIVNLVGSGFSYICILDSNDFSLIDDIEYGKDYYEIFSRIKLDEVKKLVKSYYVKSEEYIQSIINADTKHN